jgi:hypothetical protein
VLSIKNSIVSVGFFVVEPKLISKVKTCQSQFQPQFEVPIGSFIALMISNQRTLFLCYKGVVIHKFGFLFYTNFVVWILDEILIFNADHISGMKAIVRTKLTDGLGVMSMMRQLKTVDMLNWVSFIFILKT